MTQLLLEWVVTASLLILAVIALRALLGRRISAGLRYALWAVVLIRLLVPLQFFSLPVPANLPEADREPITVSAAPAATFPAIQGEPVGAPVIAAPHPGGMTANNDVTDTPSTAILDATHLWDVLNWLWLAGAMVMAAAFLFSNLTFALRLRRVRVPLEDADCPLPVYLAENLPSPCLFGLVRPSVYVTAESAQNPAMLRHILAHEYTHFRHGDYVWNLLRSAALAVHWWNPLVWLAIILNRRDCELACDEGTLKRLGDGERFAYGRTLLALITVKPGPGDLFRCATTMTGGQKSVFDRVTRIARAPKRWLWAAVVAVIATALACVCAFGQAESAEPSNHMDEFVLTYTMGEPRTVLVGGLGDAHVVWSRGTNGGALEFDGMGFCCPKLAGEKVTGGAGWDDVEKSILSVGLNVKDDLGTDIRFIISFTVDMNNSIVLRQVFRSEIEGETLELTDQEMVDIAHALAKPLTEAEKYYQSHAGELASQPGLEAGSDLPAFDLSFSIDKSNNVIITGRAYDMELGQGCYWHPAVDAMHPISYLIMNYPGFDNGIDGVIDAIWGGDSHNSVVMNTGAMAVGSSYYPSGYWSFAVDISGEQAVVTDMRPVVPDSLAEPMGEPRLYPEMVTDQQAIVAARIAARLMTEAEGYYQSHVGELSVSIDEIPTADPAPEDGILPFDQPMRLWFGSGAGGWSTIMNLSPDGSFEGEFSDSDMGVSGPGYHSTEYVCQFHGRFGEIRQVTGASWSLTLEELVIDTGHPIGEEWIEANPANRNYRLRYISSAPYGMDGKDGQALEPGARFMFYTPEASGYRPTDELYGFNSTNEDYGSIMYQFWTWMPSSHRIGVWGWDTKLGYYALCNMETGYGFFDLKAWGIE